MNSAFSPPRSSTGLIPTSHQLRMDRKASPNNFRKLPPRPPPEIYPFRGDSIIKARTKRLTKAKGNSTDSGSLQKSTTIQIDNNDIIKSPTTTTRPTCSHRKRGSTIMKSKNSIDKSKIINSKETWKHKRQWIPYNSDNEINQYSTEEQKLRQQSSSAVLKYIRKSARHREKVNELERKLDLELRVENSILNNDSSNDNKKGLNQGNKSLMSVDSEWNNSSFMAELQEFKTSMLKLCNDNHEENHQRSILYGDRQNSIKNNKIWKHNGTVMLRDCLSISSDDTSLSDVFHFEHPREESIHGYLWPKTNESFCLSDTTCFQDESLMHYYYDLHSKGKVTPNSATKFSSSLEEKPTTSVSSDRSLCEELSEEQMERISMKMKKFMTLAEGQQDKIKNMIHKNDDENSEMRPLSDVRVESVEGGTSEANETKSNTKDETMQTKADKDPVLSNIVHLISGGLFATKKDKQNMNLDRVSDTTLQKAVPTPLSQPCHPFNLPLVDDVKDYIKIGEQTISNNNSN